MGDRRVWLIVIFVLVLLLCLCTCCIGGAGILIYNSENPNSDLWGDWDDPFFTPAPPGPTPMPLGDVEPLPEEAYETLHALAEAEIPNSDLHELGIRFLGVPADTPRTLDTPDPDYPVGTRRTFNVSDVDTDRQFEIEAILIYKTEHVYMWVEDGARFNERALIQAADLFTEHTYPTTREFFGSEWNPGVDNDPRLSILHARGLGRTVAGYFSSPDSYVRAVREDSNEMEMFYINIQNVTLGDDFYNGVLAHEFQHMIHWYNDRNEETWLNEGCSELAMAINERTYHKPGTYDVGGSEYAYLTRPDTQLTTWPEGTAGSAAANYGAAYLFMEYFLERFGEDATQALVNHEENGMDSVDAVLNEELDLNFTHKEFFADWTIANLLDDNSLADGRYGYTELDLVPPRIDTSISGSDLPSTYRSDVRQYGVDYIEITANAPVRFTFSGGNLVGLMATQAHSGQYLWWSNRADESDTRLTRWLDLTDAESASVRFWAWYSIEVDWDYAYLVVGSAEGALPATLDALNDPASGVAWEILDDDGLNCTTTNPNGNSFGCGFTGNSQGWVQLEADLSDYVGQEIALRFEYITDAAVNQPGFALDDVEILIDGSVAFSYDFEEEDDSWLAEGFVRHANLLPQEWLVQLVTFGPETRVEPLLLAGEGTQGEWIIPLDNQTRRAIIALSALAPVTTEVATYELTFTLAE